MKGHSEDLLNPFTPTAVQDPYPVHRALRDAGVVYLEAVESWFITRFADVEAVLLDTERFTARFVVGAGGRYDPELAAVYSGGWRRR